MQQEGAIGTGPQDELGELIDELEQMVERLTERLQRTLDQPLEPWRSGQVHLGG